MFMEAFATGFSLSSGTKPGYSQENENYRVTFSDVLCDKTKNIVSRGFEHCYNWKAVMDLILESTQEVQTDNIIDIEAETEDSLREWLVTFQGWGLLSSVLDSKMHRHVLLSLAYTSSNWDEDTGGEFTEEKVFDTVKYVYDNMPGKELHTLLPKIGVYFDEIVQGVSSKTTERKKLLTVSIHAKWALEIRFVVEKKRVNSNLVDLSAEALAKRIFIEEEIGDLNIPETLFNVVRGKYRDIEWTRSYWDAQTKHLVKVLKNIEKDKEKKVEAEVVEAVEDEPDQIQGEEEEEEFLSAVLDDLSEDVQHLIHGDLPAEQERSGRESPAGIDGLLTLWVFIFMIIAAIVYSWS